MTGKVIGQKEIADGIFDLRIKAETETLPEPGQFLLVYPKDGARLLPRPISICASAWEDKAEAGRYDGQGEAGAEKKDGTREVHQSDGCAGSGQLRLVYRVQGGGTKEFSALKPGDEIRLSAPKGKGFPMPDKAALPILLGGGIGIPPLLFLAKKLHAQGFDIKTFLGYRKPPYFLADEFAEYGEVDLAVEAPEEAVPRRGIRPVQGAGEERDNPRARLVTELLPELPLPGTVLYACGPMPMLKAVQAYAKENQLPAWLSLEERMACGEGVCLGCMADTIEKEAHFGVPKVRVCKDGPVFAAERIVFS